jgi:hypothetical protein
VYPALHYKIHIGFYFILLQPCLIYMFVEIQEIAGGVCAGTQPRSTSCVLIPLGVHSSRQTQSVETDRFDFGTLIKVTHYVTILNSFMLQCKIYK